MDALQALHSRVSSPRLTGEVGNRELRNIFKAALRAPDHAQLRPWRFLVIKGDERNHLGELFARAELSLNPDHTPQMLAKTKAGVPTDSDANVGDMVYDSTNNNMYIRTS